jgi:hypothetical protein
MALKSEGDQWQHSKIRVRAERSSGLDDSLYEGLVADRRRYMRDRGYGLVER